MTTHEEDLQDRILKRALEGLSQTRLGTIPPPEIAMQEACARFWNEKFDDEHGELMFGSSDVTPLDCLETFQKLLETGRASPSAQQLLADFLDDIISDAKVSKNAAMAGHALANRILRTTPIGRPSKTPREDHAVNAFKQARAQGAITPMAKQAAYDAYFASAGRSYQADSQRLHQEGNFAARGMRTVEKILRDHEALEKGKPGRPRKNQE